MWLNELLRMTSSRAPVSGTGSGRSPSAKRRLASATRLIGSAIRRDTSHAASAARAAPISADQKKMRRNGRQVDPGRLAARVATSTWPPDGRAAYSTRSERGPVVPETA